MQAVWIRLEAWFLSPVPAHALVINRVVIGAVLCLHALSRLPEFAALYGSASGAWSPAYREFVRATLAPRIGLPLLPLVSALAGLPPATREGAMVLLQTLLLASSLAFALGWFTRLAGSTALALHLLFVAIHPFADWSWTQMIAPFALYVLLSRAGDYASLDALRRRHRGAAPPPPVLPAWPMRLLQVHVAAMYFHTGFARVDDPGWLRGDVLFEALAHTLFSRFDLELYAWKPALVLLSHGVFLLEPAAAFLLWIPRLRVPCTLALLAMHAVLELLTNVGWWNFVMAAGLTCFLPSRWLARLLPGLPQTAESRASPLREPGCEISAGASVIDTGGAPADDLQSSDGPPAPTPKRKA